MYMTKETFAEICKKYDLTICGNGDVENAFCFIRDLLEAESEALKANEPYATRTINRYDEAARVLDIDMGMDAFCDLYDEIFR